MEWFKKRPPKVPPTATPAARPAFDPLEVVRGYHQRTKHLPMRYAAALGYLDWHTQPDPFRRFEGAALVPLGFEAPPTAGYRELFHPGAIPPAPLDRATLSTLLFHSLALSAWKSIPEARWSLRVNPSSGNLHPTEGWLLLPGMAELEAPGAPGGPALWHYAPKEHGLERRAAFDSARFEAFQALLPPGACALALSSIPWREAWKYGERAYRYCQHDVGHGIAALRLAAALLGWKLRVLPGLSDFALERCLGLDREDASHGGELEVPDCLAIAWPATPHASGAPDEPTFELEALDQALLGLAAGAEFFGSANQLSPDHHDWEVISVIESTCRQAEVQPVAAASAIGEQDPKALTEIESGSELGGTGGQGNREPGPVGTEAGESRPAHEPSASTLIRQRRSAVSLDRRTGIARPDFEALLVRLLPGTSPIPADALEGPPRIHPVFFVNRVEGLAPGLYLLPRSSLGLERLRPRLRPEFRLERPTGTPKNLPLLLLAEGQVASLAARLACGQEIAADGAFAVAMLADFEAALEAGGPAAYRHLHWEAGLLGQQLYLEAEALGLRGTGIGCFFDDPTHSALGLVDGQFQTVYHFTLGGAVEDSRLSAEPPYPNAPYPNAPYLTAP